MDSLIGPEGDPLEYLLSLLLGINDRAPEETASELPHAVGKIKPFMWKEITETREWSQLSRMAKSILEQLAEGEEERSLPAVAPSENFSHGATSLSYFSLFNSHAADLRRMLGDEHDSQILHLPHIIPEASRLETLLFRCGATVAVRERFETKSFAVRTAWSLLNPALFLIIASDEHWENSEIVYRYLRELLEGSAIMGVPARLAQHVYHIMSLHGPGAFDRLSDELSHVLKVCSPEDFLSEESLRFAAFRIRRGISHWAIDREIMDVRLVQAMELLALTRLLRCAGREDLKGLWYEAGGDPLKMAALGHRLVDSKFSSWFEKGLSAVVGVPQMEWASPVDVAAFRALRHRRQKLALLQVEGLLTSGLTPLDRSPPP